MLRLRDEYRFAILTPPLSMTTGEGAGRATESRALSKRRVDADPRFLIRKHPVASEDAGLGVMSNW